MSRIHKVPLYDGGYFRIRQCRFCHESASTQILTKYGTRHYAHPTCYLGAGHQVEALKAFEQAAFIDKHVAEIEARKVRAMYAEHRAMQAEIEQ